MARFLVTGFEPFGPWAVNSSWEGAQRLPGRGRDVAALCLPVDHAAAADEIRAALVREAPEAVLLTGLASDPVLRLETVGRPGPLQPWSAAARTGRWPWAPAVRALGRAGLPVRLSCDAGSYVCDTTYWAALGEGAPLVAFLHVPPLGGAWTAPRIARAMAVCLSAARRGIGSDG